MNIKHQPYFESVELRDMFIDWWEGREMTLEKKKRYYEIKTSLCSQRSRKYINLEQNACTERGAYTQELYDSLR